MISGHPDEAPSTDDLSAGTDPGDSVRVTIDRHRRVVRVDVLRASGVETPAALQEAVTGAYRAAVLARRPSREPGERRERPVAVATPVTAPPRTPGSYDRHRIREATRAERARRRKNLFADRVGRSTNECVTVTLPAVFAIGRVEAEAGWLVSADPTAISRSITEAFAAAYSEGDHR